MAGERTLTQRERNRALWHGPVFGWDAVPVYLVSMVPMGIFLSIFWRRSGNLGVSGTAHALSDSVRNGILGGAP